MSKYILEVELEDDEYCYGCDCFGFGSFSDTYNAWCCVNRRRIPSDAKLGFLRPNWCPLKKVPAPGTAHNTTEKPLEVDEGRLAVKPWVWLLREKMEE